MKFVFIIENGKFIGGGEYSIFKFAEYLSKNHQILIFAQNNMKTFFKKTKNIKIIVRGSIPNYFKGIGFVNRLYDKFYTKFFIGRILEKNKSDYIIGYLRDSAIKANKLGKIYNIRVVNFVFESPPWMEEDLGERWLNEYKGRFKRSWEKTRNAYLLSDKLISISKYSMKQCESWLEKKVDGFVYPGLDFENIEKIKINKKKNQIIYVGRLNEYKNIDIIIKALSNIKNAPNLIILGDGEEKNNLIKLSKNLRVKTIFLGNISDEEKFYEIKKSLFMVFPSSHEGFGMPPMEALASGIPCICSDKGIFKEIYKEKVLYFKENDIQELTKIMEKLLKNREQIKIYGNKGVKYIRKKYSWDKSTKKILKIIENDS